MQRRLVNCSLRTDPGALLSRAAKSTTGAVPDRRRVVAEDSLRVLGIDPGSRIMGYGVVEERRGRLFHLAHGVIQANSQAPLERRLHQIFTRLSSTVSLHRPDCVAVEGVFHCRNARSALILGHARGIALLVAAQSGLPVHEYAPATVKRSVGAGGGSGKDAVAKMVHRFLQIQKPDRLDASDALAVAICHLNHDCPALSVLPRRALASLESFAKRLSPAYQRFGAQ